MIAGFEHRWQVEAQLGALERELRGHIRDERRRAGPGERCEGPKLLEVHHVDGGDVLLVPDEELRTVCRRHNPRGG